MKNIAQSLYDLVFGCHHHHISRPITIQRRTYCVCCDCGHEFDYSLEEMRIVEMPQPLHALAARS